MTAQPGEYPNPNNPNETIWWDGSAWDMTTVKPAHLAAAPPPTVTGRSLVPASNQVVGASAEAIVLSIGDISVSPNYVLTPNGSSPLAGSRWIVTDQSITTRSTPTWAVVLAILGILFFLLGLLFLFVKEDKTTGYVQVQVLKPDGTFLHSTQIPVFSPYQVVNIRNTVSQAQSLAMLAR